MHKEFNTGKKRIFLITYTIILINSIISLFLLNFLPNSNIIDPYTHMFTYVDYNQALILNAVLYLLGGFEGWMCIIISIILISLSNIRSALFSGIIGIILMSVNLIIMTGIIIISNIGFSLYNPSKNMNLSGIGLYMGFISLIGFIILNLKLSKYKIPEIEKNLEVKITKINEIEKQKQLKVISAIKKSIIECTTKFDRIKISEIQEMIDILLRTDEIYNFSYVGIGEIIRIFDAMVENNEIQAQYFASTSTIVFRRDSNVQVKPKSEEYSSPKIIPEEKRHCIVCKGEIKQLYYECLNCNAYYHLKCAIRLKDDNKTCFNCGEPYPILPKLPEKNEISDDIKDEPIVVSLQNISDELEGYLIPNEIRHKDHSAKFNQLKKNLQDDLKHKISSSFFKEFSPEIEELFKQISNIDVEDLPALENIRNYQRKLIYEIIESLKHLEGHCNNCGNRIMELNQKICEYCGKPIN